jgi:hypothetical protein
VETGPEPGSPTVEVVLIDTVILSGGSEVMDADNNIVRERHGSELLGR